MEKIFSANLREIGVFFLRNPPTKKFPPFLKREGGIMVIEYKPEIIRKKLPY